MIFIGGWLICAILSALIANSKNRSAIAWVLLTVPFGLFATVVVACMSKIPGEDDYVAVREPYVDTKTCPACAEEVKAAAQICRFCGHRFGTPGAFRLPQQPSQDGEPYLSDPPSSFKFRGDPRR